MVWHGPDNKLTAWPAKTWHVRIKAADMAASTNVLHVRICMQLSKALWALIHDDDDDDDDERFKVIAVLHSSA